MRILRSFVVAALLLGSSVPAAQARVEVVDNPNYVTAPVTPRPSAPAVAPASAAVAPTATVVLHGRIMDDDHALPGAVVVLTGTNQTTVTNAAGEFTFDVPAHAGPMQATVTYAGYTDAAVTLSPAFNGTTIGVCKSRPAKATYAKNHLR